MSSAVTIELKSPVEMTGGVKVGVLKMRAPKVRDMLTADKTSGTDAEREVRLFSNLCEVEPAVIEDLHMADYKKLQEAYRGFLS